MFEYYKPKTKDLKTKIERSYKKKRVEKNNCQQTIL